MNIFAKVGVVAIILVVLVVGLLYFQPWKSVTSAVALNKNSDFDYPESGWLSPQTDPAFANDTVLSQTDWRSNGWYDKGPIEGRNGVVVIHPLSTTEPRYIEQDVYLPPNKNYALKISVANVVSKYAPVTCNDNVFKIKIIDLSADKTETLSENVVNADTGWVDLTFDISRYAGKTVTVRVEGYAGGPCGNWNGEYGAVDYIGIIEA